MKKILSISLILAAFSFAFSGCLKDKGFDNHTYGINDPDTQPPGVGFPYGSKAKNDWGLDVTTSNQVVTGLVYVNLEAGALPKSDIHITLTNTTDAQVAAYNTANGTNIQVMPPAIYNVPLTLTIPAGERNVQVPLNVTNTTGLNSNLQYAVGLTISTVDGGYKIASNLKNLFIVFSVKNKYDGKYTMKGRFYHPSLEPTMATHTLNVELHTAGPNDVRLYWPLVGDFQTPLTSGGGPACCFADQSLKLATNPGTNVTTVLNGSNPPGTIVYEQGANTGTLNAGTPGWPITAPNPSRWDDGMKTFFISFGYNMSGGVLVPGTSRMWIDTLIRTGPR